LKQARRALLFALLFSACINVLMLVTPLYTLAVRHRGADRSVRRWHLT
jgi:ABC-type protease/lipase transport system fused ATPase/permease subunit